MVGEVFLERDSNVVHHMQKENMMFESQKIDWTRTEKQKTFCRCKSGDLNYYKRQAKTCKILSELCMTVNEEGGFYFSLLHQRYQRYAQKETKPLHSVWIFLWERKENREGIFFLIFHLLFSLLVLGKEEK